MSIKAVVFDLDDTLFPEREYVRSGFNAVSQFIESKYGITNAAEELNALFDGSAKGVFDRYYAMHDDKISAADAKELVEIYRDHEPKLTLSDDVKKTLRTLRKSGYKLGIITDGRPSGQRAKINALGLAELIDEIIITDELGGERFRKPNPKAFEMMAERLGVASEQMLYVGDNPQKDFAVKKHLPIKTAFLKSHNALYSDNEYLDGILPDTVISDISETLNIGKCNKMIRVLQVVTGLKYGGVAATIMNYYRNIDRTKIQFDFTTTEPGGRLEAEIEQLGGRIFYLPSKSHHPLKYVKQLKKIIKENDYDVVHSNTNSASAFLDLYAAKKAGCKVRVAHSHNTNCKIKWQHRIFKPLLPSVVTDRFACSKAAGEWLFGKNKDCEIINNGIDFDHYGFDNDARESVRDKMSWNDSFVIGNVASFQERKNQKFLIELMPRLLIRIPNARLILVGDGETRKALTAECGELNIAGRVEFLGNRNDVRDLLQGFDVFCFPSKFEGVSVAYMEAVASGLPVIISNDVPYIRIGNRIRSLPLDGDAWIERIVDVATGDCHRESFTREQRIASDYDIKELARKLETIYEDLVCAHEDKNNG